MGFRAHKASLKAFGGRDRSSQRMGRLAQALDKAKGAKRAELLQELRRIRDELRLPPTV